MTGARPNRAVNLAVIWLKAKKEAALRAKQRLKSVGESA